MLNIFRTRAKNFCIPPVTRLEPLTRRLTSSTVSYCSTLAESFHFEKTSLPKKKSSEIFRCSRSKFWRNKIEKTWTLSSWQRHFIPVTWIWTETSQARQLVALNLMQLAEDANFSTFRKSFGHKSAKKDRNFPKNHKNQFFLLRWLDSTVRLSTQYNGLKRRKY